MSFKELKDYQAKKQDFTIEHEGKQFKFTAHELRYFDALQVGVAFNKGENPYAMQVSRTITDENGDYMSYEQALALPEAIGQRFLEESGKVNKKEAEKN